MSIRVSPPVNGRPSFEDATNVEKFRDAKVGEVFGPSWTTFWFELEVRIGEELAGKEVHLIWDSESEAMAWSADGKPLQGLVGGTSWCRRVDYPLVKRAPAEGMYLTMFVEMACNGLFGVGRGGDIEPPDLTKTFTLQECGIATFNRHAWDLLCDTTVTNEHKALHQG